MAIRLPVSRRLAATYTAMLALVACSGSDKGINEPPRVDRVVISPDSLTVDPQQTIIFTGHGATLDGQSLPVPLTWSASGGTISAQGVYTADTLAGTYEVKATDALGHIGKAFVKVTKRPPPLVAVLELSPSIATIDQGSSFQLHATARDASGNALGSQLITWTTASASIATVDGTGLVRGLTLGTAVISAAAGGISVTATVTVAIPQPLPVATVSVSPSSSTVNQNATLQLNATTRDASGNALAGRTTSWTSSNAAVVTVDGNGLVRGVAPGNATISATSEGKSGTATITVPVPPPAPVATVTVSPAGATVSPGSTLQLGVTLRDASGNVLTGRVTTWASGNAAVASVDGNGLVGGASAGTATITGTSEGRSGTATITVPAPPPPPPPTAECAAPRVEWVWCDDFEQDRLSRYFEYDNAGGNFTRTSGTGFNGSSAMRGHWNIGSSSAGSLHLAIGRTPSSYFRAVDAGTANYREIYWRMYVKNQAGWVGGGGDKLSRTFVFASGSWAQAAIAHVWSGSAAGPYNTRLMLDPARGTDASGNLVTTAYNDFSNLTWLGEAPTSTQIYDAAHVGQWYCVEAHMRLNSSGSADGLFELWINGSLEAQRGGLNFLGSFSQYGINAIFFENYWNAGSVASQDRFFDNIVVSTARIGCMS